MRNFLFVSILFACSLGLSESSVDVDAKQSQNQRSQFLRTDLGLGDSVILKFEQETAKFDNEMRKLNGTTIDRAKLVDKITTEYKKAAIGILGEKNWEAYLKYNRDQSFARAATKTHSK